MPIKSSWSPDLLKPELAFCLLALVFGLSFLVITPPFQVPDETGHFLRAFCISEGQFRAECSVPASLVSLSNEFRSIMFRSEAKTSAARIWSLHPGSLNPSSRRSMTYHGLGVFPLAHLSPAVGVGVARLAGGGPLALFYAGRVTNLVASMLVAALAIHLAPFFKWILMLVALTPMAVSLRSSFSPDALIISLALLVVAAALRLIDAETSARAWGLLFGSGAVLVLLKPYFLLPLIVFASSRSRSTAMRTTLLVVIACCLFLSVGANILLYREPPWADQAEPRQQLANIRMAPLRFATVVASDFVRNGDYYASQIIGRLGWLDTPLPRALTLGYQLLLLGVAIADGRPFGWLQRLWFALLTIVSLAVIAASQYLFWTSPGADEVQGIQGRYLLPIVPVGLLVVAGGVGKSERRTGAISIAGAAITLAVTIGVLLRRYYW